jgi:hypothetical protein
MSELASLAQVCLQVAVRGDGDVDFLFYVRSNLLLYLLLNMYRKKPASSVGVDSACKLKTMFRCQYNEQNRGIGTETGQWR